MKLLLWAIELLAIGGFALVMAAAQRQGLHRADRSDLRWNEAHHAYLGWALCLVSPWWGGWWAFGFGLWFSVDDVVQHAVQLVTRRLTWRSLVGRGNAWLYARSRVWRWLTAQADKLLN